MSISILYVRVSSLEQRTDRQRVNEKDFDKVIEDKCSGSLNLLAIFQLMM
jgi:DNA invertase Pin-like site-specific DNA recombinase